MGNINFIYKKARIFLSN